MPKPVEIKALPQYRIWIRYDDGAQGEVDLSDLAGRGERRQYARAFVAGQVLTLR